MFKIQLMHNFFAIFLAQINKQMPRTFGDSIIHQSHFDFATCIDEPLPSHGGKLATEQETKIGQLIAENLVDDGATLQMGESHSRIIYVATMTGILREIFFFHFFRNRKHSGCSSQCTS